MRKLAILLTFVLANLPLASASDAPQTPGEAVRVTLPEPCYVEQRGLNQHLNFDFLLENLTDGRLRLNVVRLSAFDAQDMLVLRRAVNRTAVAPSIDTLPGTVLEAHGTLFIFNPFFLLDPAVRFKRLHYEFILESESGQEQHKAEVTVTPLYYEAKTHLILPLRGRVLVVDGHDFYSHHRRIDLTHPAARQLGLKNNPTRFANDLFLIDARGAFYPGEGQTREDWFGYGAPVYAPGAGRVVRVVNTIPENTIEKGTVVYAKEVSPDNPQSFGGNVVVIDHQNGEFSLIAHLKHGSVTVREGEQVTQGQYLGQMGLSGDSPEVHIHYQLQDGPDFLNSQNLPAYFRSFRRHLGSGHVRIKKGGIDTGDIVETSVTTAYKRRPHEKRD